MAVTKVPLVPLHTVPSPVEQAHITQATEASRTAMDAIATVTNFATYTLAILAVLIAIVALWGAVQLTRQAKAAAKQIANTRFDSYINSDEFKELVKDRIDRSIEARWQEEVTEEALEEEAKEPGDESAFEEKDVVE